MEHLIAGLFAGLDLRGMDGEAAWSELRDTHNRLQSIVKAETARTMWQEEWARSSNTSK
jgi:hypothetical protein